MSHNHALYRFSLTVQTDDVAVLHCLRALCQLWAGGPVPQTGWGGTSRDSWSRNKGRAVLRFASAEGRASFQKDAARLLPSRWTLIAEMNDDPAAPQR